MHQFLIEDPDPIVSIVVPVYNGGRLLASCLNSLVQQDFSDIEIIVVNDGSTDSTKDTISKFLFDRRLKTLDKENGGTGSALNAGHEVATGKYVTWCSADNFYFPNFVQRLYDHITSLSSIHFVYSDFMYITENGKPIRELRHAKTQPVEDLVNGYDLGPSFLYTKDLWLKAGQFWNKVCEDYEWATRAAQYTSFSLLPEVLMGYRIHGGQITNRKKDETDAAAEFCRQQAKRLLADGKYTRSTQ